MKRRTKTPTGWRVTPSRPCCLPPPDLPGQAGRQWGQRLGDITIMPLANGDATEYPVIGQQPQTANHYTAQAAAIDDANNPFPTIYSTLTNYPGNRNKPVVAYLAESLQASVEALTDFREVEDPDVRARMTRDSLTGSIPVGLGDELLGKVGKVWWCCGNGCLTATSSPTCAASVWHEDARVPGQRAARAV
ncbi:MAG: hypothetical protein IPJ94_19510, partial [Chloroflexi bacterium]|nr:hypothetical protein [Chloroflexota bacterium]